MVGVNPNESARVITINAKDGMHQQVDIEPDTSHGRANRIDEEWAVGGDALQPCPRWACGPPHADGGHVCIANDAKSGVRGDGVGQRFGVSRAQLGIVEFGQEFFDERGKLGQWSVTRTEQIFDRFDTLMHEASSSPAIAD